MRLKWQVPASVDLLNVKTRYVECRHFLCSLSVCCSKMIAMMCHYFYYYFHHHHNHHYLLLSALFMSLYLHCSFYWRRLHIIYIINFPLAVRISQQSAPPPHIPSDCLRTALYTRRRQPTARVPSVARGTIFNGTLSELKYSNYNLIKTESLIKHKHIIVLKLFLFLHPFKTKVSIRSS